MTGAPGVAVYQVRLPIFEGPLDLLLRLMQERRLDASLVSLAAITGDYIDRLHDMGAARPAEIADFLVIAAQLLVVKTRFLLPSAPTQAVDAVEDDHGEELLRRLHAYQMFKSAAEHLAGRLEQELVSYTRPPAPPDEDVAASPWHGLRLEELHQLAGRALRSEAACRSSATPGPLRPRWLTLEECVDFLQTQIAASGSLTFVDALGPAPERDRVVGSFLAVLHLWKQDRIRVLQHESFGDLLLISNIPAEEYPPQLPQ